MGTVGHVFDRAACKYCGFELSTNALARHEKACETASPELREKRKVQREARERSARGARAAVKPLNAYQTSMRVPMTKRERPKLDEPDSKKREYQAEYQRRYAERRKANGGLPLLKAVKHARKTLAHSAQGNGFITFQVRVDRAHLLTLLAKMAQADNSLVSIEAEDLI